MSTIKVDSLQTTGGAGLYPAKAWVNYRNKTTNSVIASGNVSSVSDNNVGVFTTSFSTAFASATYASAGAANPDGGTQVPAVGFKTANGGNTYTTTACGHASEDVDDGFSDYINNTIIYLS